MAYWLIKSEPSTWSWQDQLTQKITHWDGVRNYQAAKYMKAMIKGEYSFFYHSVFEKKIVGIVQIIKPYYPDHTDPSHRFGMVDVQAFKTLERPVSLETIKNTLALNHLGLVRQSRLSVMSIDPESWALICQLGETEWPL